MNHIFGIDTPFMRVMGVAADLVILNLLWLLCCFPIVTIGASTAALYTVSLKLAAGHDGYVWKRFFKAFRENFRQATIVHVITMIPMALLGFSLFMMIQGAAVPSAARYSMGAAALFLVLFLSWFYPLQARFENSLKNTCVNAFALALMNLHLTIPIIVLNLFPVIAILYFGKTFVRFFFFWLLAGTSVTAFINSFSFNLCFKKYIPKEILEAEEEQLGKR